MLLWWIVFGMPSAGSALEWVILSRHRRDQLRHVTVIVAMIFSTASALLGIWGLLHFQGMLLVPASTGRTVVFTGFLLATTGGLAALTWAIIERNWLSWMALAISGWMFLTWMLMVLSD
ncbi:MAG: hypothetical protein WB952_25290 [Terriglobales bacterium]